MKGTNFTLVVYIQGEKKRKEGGLRLDGAGVSVQLVSFMAADCSPLSQMASDGTGWDIHCKKNDNNECLTFLA